MMKTGRSQPAIWPGTLVGGQKETVLTARQPRRPDGITAKYAKYAKAKPMD
jgi:hypothetical protein